MLDKSHRFHGYGSLNKVYARGQVARGQVISLKFAFRDAGRPYRVAVVVSRKVSKSAVVRNRIRRRVYEQVRLAAGQVQPASDLVFLVYGDQAATMESAKLASLIRDLLQKAA